VMKGEDDIPVVWDLTKTGLNPLIFTPCWEKLVNGQRTVV
jgi:hypothetical protein